METQEIRYNDGKGLVDTEGLIDSLIVDCNSIAGALVGGNYVRFCAKVVEMVQKLSQLKEGVKNDLASRDSTITDLREYIANHNNESGVN